MRAILRRFGVIEPAIVGLPTVRIGHEHDVAAARRGRSGIRRYPRRSARRRSPAFCEQPGHLFDGLRIGILHIHVRKLVVGERPGFAIGEVDVLAIFHFDDFEQAGLAQ